MLKVIFLDIDGVLITGKHTLKSSHHGGVQFDPVAVSLLKGVLKSTGASIVLSSSWRENRTLSRLKSEVFDHYDLSSHLIDMTPVIGGETRGHEINRYLADHREALGNFVILDDAPDIHGLDRHLVRTNTFRGFTVLDSLKAQAILTS